MEYTFNVAQAAQEMGVCTKSDEYRRLPGVR